MEPINEFYIIKDGRVSGPYSGEELVGFIEAGQASPALEVCPAGTKDWGLLADYLPASVTKAASKVLVRHRKTSQWAQIAVLGTGCCLIATRIWGWFATVERRRVEGQLAAITGSGQEQDALLADSKTRLRSVADEVGAANERAKRLELKVIETESQLDQHRKKADETLQLLGDKEKALAKKDGEIKSKAAELEAKAIRGKEIEKVAVKYADRLFYTFTQLYKIGEIPKSMFINVSLSSESGLPFDVSALRGAAEAEFRRAGYRIAKNANESGNAMIFEVGINRLWMTEGPQRTGVYAITANYWARSFRSGVQGWASLSNQGGVGFASEGTRYQTDILKVIREFSQDCMKVADDVRKRCAEELVRYPLEKLYVDLTNVGLKGNSKIAPKDRQVEGSGSGVVIASRPLILTNHHVIEGAKRVVAIFGPEEKEMEAVVLFQDETRDLAVLTLKERSKLFEKEAMPVIADEGSVTTGADVFSLGYPLVDLMGTEVKYSSGAVSALTGLQGVKGRFQLSVPTQPGNSGGPVFLKEGIMCGVVVSTINPFFVAKGSSALPQNVNYAVDAESIRSFLSQHGLWEELQADTRSKLEIESAKRLTVRIAVE
jgi:S1-C subfamily serine protease